MSLPDYSFQKFKSQDGTHLANLRCHVCTKTGTRYILWGEIQQAFDGVNHLVDIRQIRVMFSIDNDGELYAPLSENDHGKVLSDIR